MSNKTKKIMITFIFLSMVGTGILFNKITDIEVKAEEPILEETVTYTPSTETHCIDNQCTQTIYSGVRFAYEDDTWKEIEDAKSLKNIWNKEYLEKDPDFDIDITEMNYTYLELNLLFNHTNYTVDELIQKYPECGSSKENDIKCDFKLTEKENVCNETDCWKEETKTQYKYQEKNGIKEDMKYTYNGIPLGKEFTFGGNSITITIYDNTTGGADSYVNANFPNNNYGTSRLYLSGVSPIPVWGVYPFRVHVRFNLSSIVNAVSIDSAIVQLTTIEDNTICLVKNTTRINVNYVNSSSITASWTEAGITWNNQPCGRSNTSLNGSCSGILSSTTVAADVLNTGYNWTVTTGASASYGYSNKLLTLVFSNTSNLKLVDGFYSKEIGCSASPTDAYKPKLYVTYTTDSTPPTYSLNSTNSTLAGTPIKHSLNWTDSVGLSSYIFSFDNCTGALANDSAVAFGAGTWSNVTKTINSTSGCTIRWCVYANDTSNNWNGTSCQNPFSYLTTTTVPNTCIYSSGDWNVQCSNKCNITSPIDVGGNDINITGITSNQDWFSTTANITNYVKLTVKNCKIICKGGCFKK